MEKINPKDIEFLSQYLFQYENAVKHFKNEFMRVANCSTDDFHIVMYLIEQGETKISKIGVRFRIKLSSLTGIIDRLEKLGYIERFFKPGDRRSTYIKAIESEKLALLKQMIYQPAARLILEILPQKQAQTLLEALQPLVQSLQNVSEETINQVASVYLPKED